MPSAAKVFKSSCLEDEMEKFKMKILNLMQAPIIIGIAHNWNARLRPSPSDIQPLNNEPRSAPARHVLTTKPTDHNNKQIKGRYYECSKQKLI